MWLGRKKQHREKKTNNEITADEQKLSSHGLKVKVFF